MYLNSLLAIQSVLEATVPEVSTFYVEHAPVNMTVPAFYLEHLASSTEVLGPGSTQFAVQWKIMYLPPVLPEGISDSLDQLNVYDLLLASFMEKAAFVAPGGIRYEVQEIAGSTGEVGMFLTVKLQTQYLRSSAGENSDLMQTIHLDSDYSR